MNKPDIRNFYLQARKATSAQEIADLSLEIANQTLQVPIWDFEVYHIFLPIKEKFEVNTELLLHVLMGKEKTIVLPRANFATGQMESVLFDENTMLKKNAFGITEPINGTLLPAEKIDVVFVPLLAFDLNGQRVGYGGGFYDRFLAECKKEVIRIGLSFFEANPPFSCMGAHDQPLDFCVTPKKIYKF